MNITPSFHLVGNDCELDADEYQSAEYAVKYKRH